MLIFIIYIASLSKDPYKTFLVYVIVNPIINKNFAILSQPGLPLLSLDMAICIYTFFYFRIYKKNEIREIKTFPLIIAFYFYLSSLLLTTLFSSFPFGQSIVKSISYINDEWLFLILFWMIIISKKDLQFILKSYLILFGIMSLYGIIEKYLGYNPIIGMESSWIVDVNKVTAWSYLNADRLGMNRVQSLTTHPITYGALLVIILISSLFMLINYENWKPKFKLILPILILLIFNIFFTNSRSPLVFLMIGAIGLINFKNKIFVRYLIPFILILALSLFVFNDYISSYYGNLASLKNINQSSVSGSDLPMRISQIMLTFSLINQSLLLGLGLGSFNLTAAAVTDLFGGESVWIQYFLERGIWGGVCYIIFIISMYKNFRIKSNLWLNSFFFFMISGWVFFSSATGEMGTRILFLTVMLIIYQLFEPIFEPNGK